jgi:hypothetical protein
MNRRKIIGVMVLLATLITALSALTLQAQDDETDDSERLLIPILLDGDTFDGEFSGSNVAQLYAFNGTEGDSVTISMIQQDDAVDPFLVLLGARGEVIGYDDDNGGDPLFSARLADVELPYSGGYFIMATTFSNVGQEVPYEDEDAHAYELTVSGNTQPTDVEGYKEDSVQYFSGPLEIGDSVSGLSTPEEPVFYFSFIGKEKQIIDITLQSEEFDTQLQIFNPLGERIGVNDDAEESTTGHFTDSAIPQLTLPMDGKYLIFATAYSFHQATVDTYEGGEFTITLTAATPSTGK